ncbi:MAG: hypothetical protein GF370_02750 [Candidatus Nealsonbacteria bacterium]|nr:hypothetical protein [Candidatus Nealsonbacteria bacterium]
MFLVKNEFDAAKQGQTIKIKNKEVYYVCLKGGTICICGYINGWEQENVPTSCQPVRKKELPEIKKELQELHGKVNFIDIFS